MADKSINKDRLGRMKQKAGSATRIARVHVHSATVAVFDQGRSRSLRPSTQDGRLSQGCPLEGKAQQFQLLCSACEHHDMEACPSTPLPLPGPEGETKGQPSSESHRKGQQKIAGGPFQDQGGTEAGSSISVKPQPCLADSHDLNVLHPLLLCRLSRRVQ